MKQLPLGAASYESTSLPFSAQRCINLYHVVAQEQSLNRSALFPTPGVAAFNDISDSPSRGSIVMDGVYYNINKTTLYSIDSDAVETAIGTITGATRVSMAHNGDKLCIVVPGSTAYVYTASTDTLETITDADFVTSDTVTFKDGFYCFSKTDGSGWFVSALNDPTDIDPLDFSTAELSPDDVVSVFASYDEVYVFGEWTIEPFRNVGGADFPFDRIQGGSLEKGTHSKYSPIIWEGIIYFIGGGINEKSGIWRTTGAGEPEKVSTDAVDAEIQKFTSEEIGNAFSFSYSLRGYAFVGFTFISSLIDNKTFVYNVTASKLVGRPVWFEQQSGVNDNYWDVASIDTVYDKLLISRLSDGQIGYLTFDTLTEIGDPLLRVKTCPPINANSDPLFFSRLRLTLDAGQGLISGQGSDPQIMLDWSDDGGRTWSNEFLMPAGKIGQYGIFAERRRMGRSSATRVYRFKQSDPTPLAWIKLEANVS